MNSNTRYYRYLGKNKFLYKIGPVPSSMCTFCKKESESIEHLLLKCEYSDSFWRELINWLNTIDIKIEALSDIDKMFGLCNRQVNSIVSATHVAVRFETWASFVKAAATATASTPVKTSKRT